MSIATLFQEVENVFRPTGIRISEGENAFVIEALVAGIKSKEIDISLDKGALSISAKSGHYNYSYLIPLEGIQIDENREVEAISEDGILKITLPKAQKLRPVKIAVK